MSKTSSLKWSSVKPVINSMSHPDLVELIRDMFAASADNRAYLTARFSPDAQAGLEQYRERITEQFTTRRLFPPLKLGQARKAIRDYRKATQDITGTVDLMLTYLESGTNCTLQYGDLDIAFYDSLISVLDEVEKLLKMPQHRTLLRDFLPRLRGLSQEAEQVAYGYDAAVDGTLRTLESIANEDGDG